MVDLALILYKAIVLPTELIVILDFYTVKGEIFS